MDISLERTYPTPYANSAILPLLLLSLSSQRITPKMTRNIDKEYDYIIVGGGTAGSVVANRLSELPCVNVLLLEAGKDPPLLTEVPGLSKFFKFTDIDWNYKTVPQTHSGEALLNRQIPLSSGKTLGGSSVFNSMVTTRGNPLDYDNWAAKGADGWSYEDVLPYFKKLEDNKDPEYIKNGFHSTKGLLTIQRPRYQSELKKPLFQAARSIGYKVVDPNALRQTGFYDFQATLRKGQRCSTSKAYLVPAENRTNLHIFPKAMVRKLIIEDGKARGVLYDYDGETVEVNARREVILSAGTINSAQLLMLSGIGPKKDLEKLEIPSFADLPVGQNLQDHCAVPLNFVLNSSIPSILMKLVNPENVDQYIKTKNGVLSSPGFITALGFVNGEEKGARNNFSSFQLHIFEDTTVIPKLHFGLKPEVYSQVFGKYENKPFATCLSQTLHPQSHGTVKLRSKNPYDPPFIDPNYLEHPNDVKDVVEGLKVCMKLAKTPAMRRLGTSVFDTVFPGCEEYKKEELYYWCLAKQVVISMNNPVGTVKMGKISDPTTVVDSHLRVKYIKGLRVVDASVMPTIISGDTHIPTIMIAERASDIIKSTIDCEDEIAESYVQASVPVMSISTDILESLPKILKPPIQRRVDTNAAMEQLKEVFGLYKRDKEAYHTSVTDKLQSRIRDLSDALQVTRVNRHRSDDSSGSTRDLVRCLEELKHQLQDQKRKETSSTIYSGGRGSDLNLNQIISALSAVTQNSNGPRIGRNAPPSNDEIPPVVLDQLLSIMDILREDREVSETSSSRAVAVNSQAVTADTINQILSALNPIREERQPQVQTADPNTGNNINNQNALMNQLLSALQNTGQTNQSIPPPLQNQNTPSTDNTDQTNIQNQLNQILSSINELRQAPSVAQNQTTESLPSNITTDRTQDMMTQILSAVNEMRESTRQNTSEVTTTPASNGNSEETALNKVLQTLKEIRQNDQSLRHEQIYGSPPNTNKNNSNDLMLSHIVSSINEMKEEIRAVKKINGQNLDDAVHRQGIATLQDQNQRLIQALNQQAINQQAINQQAMNQQAINRQVNSDVRSTTPLIETLILQQPPSTPQQINVLNPILPPVIQPGINGLPIGPQPVQNLLPGQRTLQLLSSLLGRNPQPPVLPPPIMGIPPGVFPIQQFPRPPPFLPPGIPPNPCQNTIVMNNINLCNTGNNPLMPLTPREAELCQSLLSATQCQNGNNCRSLPPYLYNHYCSGK